MLHVETFTLGLFEVHNYLMWDDETREAVLFDTGKNPVEILDFIRQQGLTLNLLLYTHTHIDHIEGHHTIREAYPDLPAWMHAEDQFWVDLLPMQAERFGFEEIPTPIIQNHVQPGQVLSWSGHSIEARFCPGHTPGGISYYVADGPYVFTGDTIFKQSIGRTDFPRGDFDTLIQSINTQIMTLPDDTLLFSGHGEVTTVGAERRENPFVLQYCTAR